MTLELLGLLTRIRLTRRQLDLETAASQQFLFPLVGLVVGLTAALAILALDFVMGDRESILSGALLVVFLYGVTGIMHTEGLADMADGVMAHGTPQRKREIMKDPHVGVAAVMAIALFVLTYFVLATRMCTQADRTIHPWPDLLGVPFVLGIVVSEVAGKLSMNVSMFMGPSSHVGMGSLFVGKADASRMLASLAVASIVCFAVVGILSVIVLIGVFAGALVTLIARKHFEGVSGDVFGAANEIGRISALLVWVIVV